MERFDGNEIIRQIIENEDLAQTKVSEQVFGTKTRLANYFKRDVEMSMSNFAAVCDAMGYDVVVVRREQPPQYAMKTEPKRTSRFKGKDA